MITANIKDIHLELLTAPGVFSPRGVDMGTLAMLRQVSFMSEDKLLDLGCGYGIVGILAARIIGEERVVMCDVDPKAIELARQNTIRNGVPGIRIVCSDGFNSISDTGFTLILSNPPYNSNFSVAKRFIEKGFNRLTIGGRLIMVVKRPNWYKNKLIAIFGGVKTVSDDGYFIFTAEKRSDSYANHR